MKKFVLFLFFLFIATVSQAKLDFSDFATKGFEGKGKLEFHSPEDVIMTNDGQFIIADQRNNRLQVLDSKGDFVRFIPENKNKPVNILPPEKETPAQKKAREATEQWLSKCQSTFTAPIGLAMDSKGLLYVSMMNNHNILIIDFSTGQVIDALGGKVASRKQNEFFQPMDIDISPKDLLAVAEFKNNRVQIIDLSTKKCVKELIYQQQEENKKPVSLSPRGVHWTNDGRLLVSYPSYNQIVCWQPLSGEIIWRYGGYEGSEKGKLYNPSYICEGVDGGFLVTDTLNNRIVEISRDGKFVEHYSKRGTAPGKLYGPRGLVLTPDENLFVIDQSNNRVQFFRPGQATLTLREAKQFALQDDWENAKLRIIKVLNLQPNNEQARDLMVNALYYFGDQAFNKGDYKTADDNYRSVMKYRPDDVNVKEKLDKVFWASNEQTITTAILIAVSAIGFLFCLWIVKMLVKRLWRN